MTRIGARILALSDEDRAYLDRDSAARYRVRLNAMMLGVLLYVPFGAFDIFAFPDHAGAFVAIRAICVAGMIAGCLLSARAKDRPWREAAILGYGAFALGGMFWMATVDARAASYFHFGAAVSLFYGGMTFHPRPFLMVLVTAFAVPAYAVSQVFTAQPFPLALLDTALLTITLGTCFVANVYRDRLERQRDVDVQALRFSKQETERALGQALAADRAKADLLAGVSHELRTPMNAIVGFSDAMRMELMGPLQPSSYRDYVDHIHASGLILRRNIDDLLDMSSFATGTVVLTETRFRVGSAVEAAMTICSFRARERGVELRVIGRATGTEILADKERLEQALINLVTNAIAYSPEGDTVIVRIHPPDVRGLAISVIDHGPGMSGTVRDRATAPFARGNRDSYRSGKGGLGIGLAIVTCIMEALDGELRIDSTEGEGTTATLLLPRHRVPERSRPTLLPRAEPRLHSA